MKTQLCSILILLSAFLLSSCNGKGGQKKDVQPENEISAAPDTGFTGIKQYMSGNDLIKEITFKNGVRNGLMKSFYQSRKVRQTFWYIDGLREDSAKWFYEEGQLFRASPYKHDTIDGIQQQYYRSGKIKAQLGYKKGYRTPYLKEFTSGGKVVGGYPVLEISIKDEYQTRGLYRITLRLSDKSDKVRYYRGDFQGGVFDTTLCRKIKSIDGTGNLDLRKTASAKSDSIGVIAEILTGFGNNLLVHKKIGLPYTDLK